jgi:hypothetical protein
MESRLYVETFYSNLECNGMRIVYLAGFSLTTDTVIVYPILDSRCRLDYFPIVSSIRFLCCGINRTRRIFESRAHLIILAQNSTIILFQNIDGSAPRTSLILRQQSFHLQMGQVCRLQAAAYTQHPRRKLDIPQLASAHYWQSRAGEA